MIRFILGTIAAGLFAWGPLTMEKPTISAQTERVYVAQVIAATGGPLARY